MAEPQNLLDMPANIGIAILRDRVQQAEKAEAEMEAALSEGDKVAMALQAYDIIRDDGHVDMKLLLTKLLEWPGDDGPVHLTEAEAQAGLDFLDCIIAGRKVWPTDSVGAGLKLADCEHEWAALPEPDEWGHDDEEDAIESAVVDYLVRLSDEPPERADGGAP